MKLTEGQAQNCLKALYSHHQLGVPNVYFAGTEIDFLVLSTSDSIWEIEIKLTYSDWLNDQHKRKWNSEGDRLSQKISRFFYAIPESLADKIPDFVRPSTGIICFRADGNIWRARVTRPAAKLSGYKSTADDRHKLLTSTYHRFWQQRWTNSAMARDYQILIDRHRQLQGQST